MEINTGTIVALLMAIPILTKTVDKLVDKITDRHKNNKTNGYLREMSNNQLKITLTLGQISGTLADMKDTQHRELNGATDRIVDKINDSVITRLDHIDDRLRT